MYISLALGLIAKAKQRQHLVEYIALSLFPSNGYRLNPYSLVEVPDLGHAVRILGLICVGKGVEFFSMTQQFSCIFLI